MPGAKILNIKPALILIGILFIWLSVTTEVLSNSWCILTCRNFIIPHESTIATFKVTVMNNGSGDWWVYGEDAAYYYHFTGDDNRPYTKILRKATSECNGFNPQNYETWCNK